MTAPNITIRKSVSPFDLISSVSYYQSKIGSSALPVLQGESSVPIIFRIYNNFALAAGIEDALNVFVTVYDGAGIGSHTALNAPASQSWLHVLQNGFGQNTAITPDILTRWIGQDTPIGGNNIYTPDMGSAGVYGTPTIVGSGSNAGYIELKTYLTPATDAVGGIYNFIINITYEYV